MLNWDEEVKPTPLTTFARTPTDIHSAAAVQSTPGFRTLDDGATVNRMTLEHYPGMTEKALEEIGAEAARRWDILDSRIVHRVGPLEPGDAIVLVAVSSAHRGEAFAACEFIMDFLKTRAPFWKKEATPSGERWVEAKVSDDEAAARWSGAGEGRP